nr:sn-glycerol-3-phosphate ABC transporter ATP-binding protein UgpC [Bacillus sp. FJAT-42315]
MSKIQILNLAKQYDNQGRKTIDHFNLNIEEKEFIVIVGPSGCGKSTMLRMLAGLEPITAGELWMDNKLVNDVPPKDRDIALVFQNYALYPHLTVFDNIAFGLKIRKTPKDEIKKKVDKAAGILGLTDYLKRKPKALSGGQKQRVALGRAIVRNANIFLMDEPLSNLDAKLRGHMREEIMNLHRRLEATTIYVTHDQTEAMTMASRIVVLKDGYIQQVGTPKDVYKYPENMFVAGFIGSSSINFLKGNLVNRHISLLDGESVGEVLHPIDHEGEVMVGIRPEHIQLANEQDGIKMVVDFIEMMGADLFVHGELQGTKIKIRVNPDKEIQSGDTIYLKLEAKKIHLFDPSTERTLYRQEELV